MKFYQILYKLQAENGKVVTGNGLKAAKLHADTHQYSSYGSVSLAVTLSPFVSDLTSFLCGDHRLPIDSMNVCIPGKEGIVQLRS